MAKITKIIGYTVAVSALWLGGTAYISSTTESYLDMYVKKTNNLYKSNGMEMSVENFERGFFSSNAKMKIDFIEPKLREVIAQSIKLPIEVNYELENGPLFFKNGLGFGSSRVHTTVDLSEYVVDKDAFKKMFKDDIRLTSSMSIDFFKNASFSAKTNQLLVDVDEDIVEVSASATASNASSCRIPLSVRQSFASSIAARVRLPLYSCSLASNFSNKVNASAVPPAKPAITLSSYKRRTFRALPFIIVLPNDT